jgi:hypothetical protein
MQPRKMINSIALQYPGTQKEGFCEWSLQLSDVQVLKLQFI